MFKIQDSAASWSFQGQGSGFLFVIGSCDSIYRQQPWEFSLLFPYKNHINNGKGNKIKIKIWLVGWKIVFLHRISAGSRTKNSVAHIMCALQCSLTHPISILLVGLFCAHISTLLYLGGQGHCLAHIFYCLLLRFSHSLSLSVLNTITGCKVSVMDNVPSTSALSTGNQSKQTSTNQDLGILRQIYSGFLGRLFYHPAFNALSKG